MTQDDFYRETVSLIVKKAEEKDPYRLAHVLYLHMKQHPENVKVDRAWGTMLRNIKILLNKHFCWDFRAIHTFLIQLKKLTQYMEKST